MDEQQFRLGFHFCQERWRRKPRPVITRMLHWTETVTNIGRCRVSGRGGSELGMSASGNRWLATAKNSCGSFLKLSWSRNLNPEVRVYSSGSQQVDDEDAKLIDFLRRETTEQRTAKDSPHQWALSMGFAVRPSFLPKSNQFIKSLLALNAVVSSPTTFTRAHFHPYHLSVSHVRRMRNGGVQGFFRLPDFTHLL
ncbi:unnamed protein product [Arabidopsis thaliana]|uniref:Uncharacterized protein n=1 Tax=Arabidopsis thaliana TaxID=3702 RepID=A0A654EUR5_ARATH|nr:unnamed protein product [Arabidopsis thaliana]